MRTDASRSLLESKISPLDWFIAELNKPQSDRSRAIDLLAAVRDASSIDGQKGRHSNHHH